jgi:arginase family enzyme
VDGTLTPVRDVSVVALLCRTSDRVPHGAAGAEALAATLAGRAGAIPRLIGSPGTPRATAWEDDLRDARGCLLEAGGQLDDALVEGRFPVLLASDCSICVATLPALARRLPAVRVLWLDAHADFNTPETTPSAFLGGMCLAGACGLWDTGFGGDLDPARVLMCGVREVDAGERPLLDTRGVGRVDGRPSTVAGLLAGEQVFIHLDLDVLDPAELPGTAFPAGGGFGLDGLSALLAEVAASADVVGAEITSFTAPQLAPRFAEALTALLPAEARR